MFLIYWRYVTMDFLTSFFSKFFNFSSTNLMLFSLINRELNPGDSQDTENSLGNGLCFI